MYTIGVLTDVSPQMNSKNGKKFGIFKISDLVKYDLNQVKASLTSKLSTSIKSGAVDKDELAQSLKAYTPNGYKNLSFMSFGDASAKMHLIRPGTVVAVINPRLMPKRGDEHANSFCIESEAQVMIIGYSEDYDVCKSRTRNTNRPGSLETFQCRTFLNKSVEDICDKHKMERKLMHMERQKGQRLNLAGDRVDCNQIKRMEARNKKEFGAFGGKQVFTRDIKPARLLSPKAQAKVTQIKEKQQEKFTSFMGNR